MDRNITQFVESFKRIEEHLMRYYSNGKAYVRFNDLVDYAKTKSAAVAIHSHELKQYGQLRNALSHTSLGNTRFLAIPHDDAINEISLLEKKIIEPKRIHDYKKDFPDVIQIGISSQVQEAVRLMGEYQISQIAVVKEEIFLNMLTAQTIIRFLGLGKNVLNSPIGDCLNLKEETEDFKIRKQTDMYLDVIQDFAESQKKR